ncbi:MAG: DUF126 domain-containing protein [Archaeoglobaceae archaeon]
MSLKFACRGLYGSRAEGEAVVSRKQVSFFGDVNEDGVIVAGDSDVRGTSIAGKVFAFPSARGSTVGSYALLRLKKAGKAPVAIINAKSDIIVAAGAVLADIVLVDKVEPSFFEVVKTGDWVIVDAEKCVIVVE